MGYYEKERKKRETEKKRKRKKKAGLLTACKLRGIFAYK